VCTWRYTLLYFPTNILKLFWGGVEVLGFAVSFSAAGELSPPLFRWEKLLILWQATFPWGAEALQQHLTNAGKTERTPRTHHSGCVCVCRLSNAKGGCCGCDAMPWRLLHEAFNSLMYEWLILLHLPSLKGQPHICKFFGKGSQPLCPFPSENVCVCGN